MALVTTKEMFEKAYNGGYAVGAFNVNNMEIVQGITEAAGELKSPVILQVSKGARAYANHTYLVKLVEAAIIENPEIPIALHLDHGDTFELCKSCIDGGFTSVMIDASSKSFEENIALTRQVVEYAHDHGVVVEAELGTLAGNLSAAPAVTLLRSRSALLTAPTSSKLPSAPATRTAFLFRLLSASTCCMSASSVFPASRSFCMVLPPCRRNSSR